MQKLASMIKGLQKNKYTMTYHLYLKKSEGGRLTSEEKSIIAEGQKDWETLQSTSVDLISGDAVNPTSPNPMIGTKSKLYSKSQAQPVVEERSFLTRVGKPSFDINIQKLPNLPKVSGSQEPKRPSNNTVKLTRGRDVSGSSKREISIDQDSKIFAT